MNNGDQLSIQQGQSENSGISSKLYHFACILFRGLGQRKRLWQRGLVHFDEVW